MKLQNSFLKSLFVFAIVFICSVVITNKDSLQKSIKAVESNDFSTGEKIIDIETAHGIHESKGYFALSESGNLYSWGLNINGILGQNISDETYEDNTPRRVKCNPGDCVGDYLTNVKKIGYFGFSKSRVRGFAITNDGKLYAWGDNGGYGLGLPEDKIYTMATLVNLPVRVKDVLSSDNQDRSDGTGSTTQERYKNIATHVISENGDLYGVGNGWCVGTGNSAGEKNFIKISKDAEGKTIQNVKQMARSRGINSILMENGTAFQLTYTGDQYFPKSLFYSYKNADRTPVTNVDKILFADTHIFYLNKDKTFSVGMDKVTIMLLSTEIIVGRNIKDFTFFGGNGNYSTWNDKSFWDIGFWAIDSSNKIYFTGYDDIDKGIHDSYQKYNKIIEYIPNADSDYSKDMQKPIKIVGARTNDSNAILSDQGTVYFKGKRMSFKKLAVAAFKPDSSPYISEEKYNNNLRLNLDISGSEYDTAVKYRIIDMEDASQVSVNDMPEDNQLEIIINEGERYYKRYEFYQLDHESDTLVTLIVDLYKDTPKIEGLTDNTKYKIDKSFIIPAGWNPFSATLQKEKGNAIEYVSNTPIHEGGNFTLNLKDSYGNEKSYSFTIDVPMVKEIIFTKSGNLVYGDATTLANQQIGTISLKYNDNIDDDLKLKSAKLGSGGDEDKFSLDANENSKLIAKEKLNAGSYLLHISGVDTNDIPFDGIIEFTISPIDQSSGNNKFDFIPSFSSGELLYGDTLDLEAIVTGGASSITPKFTVVHDYGSGAVITDGKITPTNIGSFELEAKKEDPDGNYTTATITKTITVKPKPITISVKDPITKKAGAALPAVGDNYTITPALVSGDTLSSIPVYEYIGSADNNSTSNVKVKISGLSNDKYDITFTEHDVTVTQDTNGTEGTNYEITGTKGENDWYTTDVTFKLLGPAFTAGYDLFSNTNTFSADNFIVNSEGKNSVKFRMKNSTTGALTSQDTKEIKIDKTAPVISKIDYAEKDGNNKTPVTDKTFAYYFVHGVDIKVQASDVTSGIVKYKMVATPLNNDGTIDDTKSKISEETATTEGTHKFTISQQGNYEIEIIVYDEAGNSVNSTKVKAKINENTGELTAKALINNDASKPYDGTNWTNQKINITLNCTNDSGVTGYYWSNDGGATFTKMNNNKLEISNTSTINNVVYSFKAMTQDGNELTATLPIKIDVTKPTVTGIQYTIKTRSALQSFLNTVTFDHYFKEEQTATFQGEDKESGIDTFEYSVTRVDKNLKPIGTADKGTGKTYDLELDKNYKVELYALDKAGNKSGDPVFSETVSIDSTLGDLELEAYINNDTSKPYDGTKWVHEPIAVHLNVKGNAVIEEYAYSSGGSFIKCDTNVCMIPSTSNITDNINDKEYSFRIKDENGNVTTKKMNIKIDITKPLISVDAKTGNQSYIEGDTATEDITLELNKENTNLSGSELFYTKDSQVASTLPSLVNGWKAYKNTIMIDTSGEETYYFASMSGAGIASEVKEFHTKLMKLDYNDIKIEATSNGKRYTGDWTNDDVTFTIRGGIEDTTLIQNYQYAITTGAAPDGSTVWNNVSGSGQHIVSGNTDKTYWFRVVPVDANGKTSLGYSVKIDTTKPDDVTFKTKSVAKGVLNSIADLLTTGDWSNSALQVEMESGDRDSGIKEIKYIETKNGTHGSQKVYSAPLIYKEDGIISFKATAYDNAGNASQNESISDTYRIDVTRPTIKGAEDGKVYYYVTRYITYEDLGSGIKDALVSFNNAAFDTLNNGHKLSAEGDYTLKVSDEAGNVHEINFKIIGLPDMGDIDGSDESRDIIDQVIDEYEEVKGELTEDEKKEIEEWIDEAEKKWEAARNKIIKDESSGVIVEGVDNVTFDPNTELVVKKDESVKDKDISKVPGIDKNEEIKEGFDVKLKKGEMVVQPDGSVTIKIPIRNEYKYSKMKVVMIDDKGDISLVNAEVKNGYIVFTTDKPNNKFALVGEKEKDPNVDKDTDGDGLPDVNVDVDVDGKADINIDTDGDGIPDINIDTDGDGKPDYNVDRDGDKKPDYNVGPIHKPWKPDLCVDYDKDDIKDWCTDTYHKPYLNIDTDNDGLPDLNLDIDGDMKADINIDINNDNIPDLNIDTDGDGKADINIDDNDDGKADRNIKKLTEWIPDKNDGKVNGFTFDTMGGLKPDEVNGGNNSNNNNTNNGGTSGGSSGGNSGTSVKGATKTNTLSNVGGAGTGDTTNWLWWIVCLILSASTLVIARLMKRHKKMN